jgi:hypothetical protein
MDEKSYSPGDYVLSQGGEHGKTVFELGALDKVLVDECAHVVNDQGLHL